VTASWGHAAVVKTGGQAVGGKVVGLIFDVSRGGRLVRAIACLLAVCSVVLSYAAISESLVVILVSICCSISAFFLLLLKDSISDSAYLCFLFLFYLITNL
jgi:hypothetical protein